MTTDRVFLRAAIVKALARYAYQYKPGGFTLTSGAVSDDYLDCKQALCQGHVLWTLGQWLEDTLLPEVTAVGGMTMGADLIAIAASVGAEVRRLEGFPARRSSYRIGPGPTWFSVRKEPKSHGSKRRIEGFAVPGAHVCVVDDVCTTGGSTISAIQACRAEGLIVAQVIMLVDREEQSGMMNIQMELDKGTPSPVMSPLQALTTKSEVRAAWQELQSK